MERPEDEMSPRYGHGQGHSFQDVIEMVAAANEHHNGATDLAELPELRASPCLFHNRSSNRHNQPPQHRQQQHQHVLHYSGASPSSPTSKMTGSKSRDEPVESRLKMEKSILFQHGDGDGAKSQHVARPHLPHAMASKAFIKSWLQHGSQPIGHVHFPEVIPQKPANQSTPLRVGDRKETLAPIFRTMKAKRKKRNNWQ